MEDAILSSCFDANGGLFETLLGRKMPLSPTP
jgi:7-keto-8-aminopelargonate synthetase-like enzyme